MHVSIPRRLGGLVAVGLALTLGLSACSSSSPTSNTSKPAATATSLAGVGTLDDLYAAAKTEGALNVIALPRDWANYGAVIDAFKALYPGITVNEQNPNGSSADEIAAAKTNKGLDTAPDVFDLGLAVALSNTDQFAPYKVSTWDDVPAELKDDSGLYFADYGGFMSLGIDSAKYPVPTSIQDLLQPQYKGAVAINGDPTQAGSAFAAIGLATLLNGGTLDDFTPGIDFFSQMNQAGNFLKVDPTDATIASGETPIVFDWDYLNAVQVKSVPTWQTVIFPGEGYAGYYYQAINAGAPHPAAARLWEEFLYSDQGQNLFLGGGARPSRMEAMTEAGTIDTALAAALPVAPEDAVVPTQSQSSAAGTLLGQKWASAIG
ncbi:MAG: extracellular solute-binding protein [Propionibacteriaceae bacterium]|nr:extracellular solute-binding protein [Propionibacteriaceae bacterium]